MEHELKPAVPKQMRDVLAGTGDQVVHADDVVPFSQKAIREVRAQEPGCTGYQEPHVPFFRPMP
jgi:hypothetical protein